jgi:hypothetical protein
MNCSNTFAPIQWGDHEKRETTCSHVRLQIALQLQQAASSRMHGIVGRRQHRADLHGDKIFLLKACAPHDDTADA